MAEIGEMRAQRLEACERDDPSTCGKTITLPTNRKGIVSVHGPCDGCNRDGTRWVTVGTLRPIGGNGEMVAVGDRGEWKRVPAYTIEETP